jgi:4-aminobutyrate aminotransferase-like enzyme
MVSAGAEKYPNRFDPENLDRLDLELQENVRRRLKVLGPGYLLIYENPVSFVSGSGAHLFDAQGNDYLDAYNNVPVVGHCHPHVVEAVSRQMATLNTNTRYAQQHIVDYAERLLGYFPDQLSRLSMTCTGSEANDLAIRVARYYTGNEGIIVSRYAYHGITREVASFSPQIGTGSPLGPNVRLIDAPDTQLLAGDETMAQHMLAETRRAIADLHRHGHGVAALILDLSFMSDGIYPEPTGYLQPMIDEVHDAGGVFICDEVQAGFARLGECMWGFRRHGVTPDIVTLGKPMGNGLPLAGVVFRPEVCEEFGENVRYFNTFGGSTVPVAAGNAVLDVFESEGVPQRAESVGAELRSELSSMLSDSPHVCQVRGAGLLASVEIVTDRETRTADRPRANAVINGLRDRFVLVNGSSPGGNSLKIRPPLAFTSQDAARFLVAFGDVAERHLF